MTYLELVTECEHGHELRHCVDHPDLAGTWHPEIWGYPPSGKCTPCPGGSRVSVEDAAGAVEVIRKAVPDLTEDARIALVSDLRAIAEGIVLYQSAKRTRWNKNAIHELINPGDTE
jgi:hypothetical protein